MNKRELRAFKKASLSEVRNSIKYIEINNKQLEELKRKQQLTTKYSNDIKIHSNQKQDFSFLIEKIEKLEENNKRLIKEYYTKVNILLQLFEQVEDTEEQIFLHQYFISGSSIEEIANFF